MSDEVLKIFLEYLIQNNWKSYYNLPVFIELLSKHTALIAFTPALRSILIQGFNHQSHAVKKCSLYILSTKIPNFQTDPVWIQFSTYFNSLNQTNKSILEPLLQQISNVSLMIDRYDVDLFCVLWDRAISNENMVLKKMALEYFLQLNFSFIHLSTVQSDVWLNFLQSCVFKYLDNFFLYTEYSPDNLICKFGELVESWIHKMCILIGIDFVNFAIKHLSIATTMSFLIYSIRGLNRFVDKNEKLDLDLQLIFVLANNRSFFSDRLKFVWYSELIELIMNFQSIKPSNTNGEVYNFDKLFKVCSLVCGMLRICKSKIDQFQLFLATNLDGLMKELKMESNIQYALNAKLIGFDNFEIFFILISLEEHSLKFFEGNHLFNLIYCKYFIGEINDEICALLELYFLPESSYEDCLKFSQYFPNIPSDIQTSLMRLLEEKFSHSDLNPLTNFKVLLFASKLSPIFNLEFSKIISSIDFSRYHFDSSWKLAKSVYVPLRYELFFKLPQLLPVVDAMLEDLENSISTHALPILKCFSLSPESMQSSVVRKVFEITTVLLAECQTNLPIYFALLQEFLRYVFTAYNSTGDSSIVSSVIMHLLGIRKKGVDFTVGNEFMQIVLVNNPANILNFTDEFVHFLGAGSYLESAEEQNNELLCGFLCPDVKLDIVNSSSLMIGLKLRAMYNGFLGVILESSSISESLTLALFQKLLSSDCDCTLNINDMYPSTSKQKLKLRYLMSLCLLIGGGASKNITESVQSFCLELLKKEALQSVRYFLEFILVQIIRHSINPFIVFQQICNILTESITEKPSYLVSIMTVIMHSLQIFKSFKVDFLFPKLICLFLNGNHTIRIFACYMFNRLFTDSTSKDDTFAIIAEFIQQNDYAQKTIQKLDATYMLSKFDPIKDCTFEFIFVSMVHLGDERCYTESIPVALFQATVDTVSFKRIPLSRQSNSTPITGWKSIDFKAQPMDNAESIGLEESTDLPEEKLSSAKQISNKSNSPSFNSASIVHEQLQRKIVPWELSSIECANFDRMSLERKRTYAGEIIVVASLLEKAPNLAGLCRTCEIFAVSTLVLPSLTMAESPAFKGQSATADQWLHLAECSKEQLGEYLQKRQSEGFELVGLEQTSKSILLDKYKCSSKTVLLLGNEKHGIPVEILNLLQKCVEIPQFGVVRSLNVHVSGSLILWEMRKQLSLN